MFDTLTPPAELQVPRMRYWGDRKPPKNRVDMFSVRVATNAVLTAAAGADSSSDVVGSVATLRIYGPIDSWGGWWGVSAKDVAGVLDELPDDVVEVRVRINSPGGEVWEGMAILNMLRAHKARAVAVVDGLAASAASVIAAGCEETVMSPGTQMMIHDPSGFAYGPASVMTKAAKFLDSCGKAIASIYTEAAGGTDDGWRTLMIEETWYTAAEAVDSGLADRVAVVPDAGETSTAGEEPEPTVIVVSPDEVEDLFDLTIYSHAGRSHAPAPKPPTASADGTTQPEGAAVVDLNDTQVAALREQVGFAADADADTLVAAVTEALTERSEDIPEGPQIPEGMVLLDGNVLSQLQADATAGREANQTLATQERDRQINAALSAGKITATSRDQFVAAWDKDPTSTKAILDALTPGLVPTSEAGHESEPNALGEGIDIDDAELEAFAASLGLTKEALRG
jgi:ATP-dependent protease ClpP protease subunit